MAYRAALEENTQERVPLDWAMSLGNQGVAMKSIAERTNDAALAKKAFEQISTAYETMRSGGYGPFADYYQEQLSKACSLLAQLSAR